MMGAIPGPAVPEPAAMLDRLPAPELDIDEDAGEDLHRIELRRMILEIAEIGHAQEIAAVEAAAERFRGGRARQ
ncbi:hypothetical protein GCM10010169_33910 [Micromonospora fulviviridis]|uniref:hypothetical protein n=1 Tax=Micromonospora fulviviridis TaxID=47860 RepID=UPI0016694D6D|nr:hypothetical protein [Micromonospora fulviviridis]GGR86911.1 hypothetical protein GCM10010169_33910 [Micromonospora fulviviridis]